jgi:hypothetical protein
MVRQLRAAVVRQDDGGGSNGEAKIQTCCFVKSASAMSGDRDCPLPSLALALSLPLLLPLSLPPAIGANADAFADADAASFPAMLGQFPGVHSLIVME